MPKEVREYHGKELLIGHVASGIYRKYTAVQNYKDIKESDALTIAISGEQQKAIQWVFQTQDAVALFEQECRGREWIHRLGTHVVPLETKK